MSRHRQHDSPFRLLEIPAFDARRGHRRCLVPGVDVSVEGRPPAKGDIWRAADGGLVIRLSSQGYREHCRAVLRTGGSVPDDRLDEFVLFLSDVVLEWLIDGVDDTPEAFDA
jgi:hypothetical protein